MILQNNCAFSTCATLRQVICVICGFMLITELYGSCFIITRGLKLPRIWDWVWSFSLKQLKMPKTANEINEQRKLVEMLVDLCEIRSAISALYNSTQAYRNSPKQSDNDSLKHPIKCAILTEISEIFCSDKIKKNRQTKLLGLLSFTICFGFISVHKNPIRKIAWKLEKQKKRKKKRIFMTVADKESDKNDCSKSLAA